jgi:hypothetical protein
LRQRLVTTVVSQGRGSATVAAAAIHRSNAVWSTSSASHAEPRSLYASENSRRRSASNTSPTLAISETTMATLPAASTARKLAARWWHFY